VPNENVVLNAVVQSLVPVEFKRCRNISACRWTNQPGVAWKWANQFWRPQPAGRLPATCRRFSGFPPRLSFPSLPVQTWAAEVMAVRARGFARKEAPGGFTSPQLLLTPRGFLWSWPSWPFTALRGQNLF